MIDRIRDIDHAISPELVKAYREALYVIYGEGGDIQLRVGQSSPELTSLMRSYGASSAAFLTAFNPHSMLEAAEVNVTNHNALIADIHTLGLKSISGEGGDPSHLWPSEPSLLVLGISHQNAELLAEKYGQNAYLWIEGHDGLVNLNLRYPVRNTYQ
jgi:hypothetical protein